MPETIPILVAAPAQPGVSGSPAARPPGPGGLASFKSNLRQALQRGNTLGLAMSGRQGLTAVAVDALPPGLTSLPDAAKAVPVAGIPVQAHAVSDDVGQPKEGAPAPGATDLALAAQQVLAATTPSTPPPAPPPEVSTTAGAAPVPAETDPTPSTEGVEPHAPSHEGTRGHSEAELPAHARANEVAPPHGGTPPGWARVERDEPHAPKGLRVERDEPRAPRGPRVALEEPPKAGSDELSPAKLELPVSLREHLRVAVHGKQQQAAAEQLALPAVHRQAAEPEQLVHSITSSAPDAASARGEGRTPDREQRETREVSNDMGSKKSRTVAIPADGTIDFDLGRLVRLAAGDAPKGVMPATADLRPTPVERQVVEALRIMPKSDGQHEVRMRLNPPELGEVHVRMLVKEGNASVFMSTHTDVAREAIQSALPQLREVLEARDLKPQELHVSLDGSKTGSQMPEEQRRERREEQRPEAAVPWAQQAQAKRGQRERVQVTQLDVMA